MPSNHTGFFCCAVSFCIAKMENVLGVLFKMCGFRIKPIRITRVRMYAHVTSSDLTVSEKNRCILHISIVSVYIQLLYFLRKTYSDFSPMEVLEKYCCFFSCLNSWFFFFCEENQCSCTKWVLMLIFWQCVFNNLQWPRNKDENKFYSHGCDSALFLNWDAERHSFQFWSSLLPRQDHPWVHHISCHPLRTWHCLELNNIQFPSAQRPRGCPLRELPSHPKLPPIGGVQQG